MKRLLSLLLSVVLVFGMFVIAAQPVMAQSNFTASDEVVEMLKKLEGFDKYPRWDYKQWTVGYGSRCPDEDLERYRKYGITEKEADKLLRDILATFAKSVNSFNDKHELNFKQNQFDALLLFTYNFGPAWMVKDGTFRTSILNGETGNDLLFTIGKWCHAGDKVMTYLVKRRMMEYNMYVNGVYSREVPENYCYVLFDFNGGDGETDIQCYDSNLKDAPRVIPEREGYTFTGWYTEAVGGKKITVLDASTQKYTLYAHWVEAGKDPGEEPSEPVEPSEPEEQPEEISVAVTVTATNVNVRKGPGTNYSVVGRVTKGDKLTITQVQTGTGYTWGKCELGWLVLKYTDYDEVIKQEEETTPPETQPEETTPPETQPEETTPPETQPEETTPPETQPEETTPPETQPEETTPPETQPEETTPPETQPEETVPPVTEPEEPKVMGTVIGSNLRIRKGAGTGYAVLGFLQIGDRVEILEQKMVGSMNWGRIDKGWISLTYVKLDEPAVQEPEEDPVPPVTEPEETTPPETQPEETTPPETQPEETTPPETQPEETTPPETEPVKPETMTGKVKVDDRLRIRSGAGTGYSVVGYLFNGAKVEILETKTVAGMTWGRISKGWISMDYVVLDQTENAPEEKPQQPEKKTMTVIADCLRIRNGAGTGYKIVGYLYQGAKVEVLETKDVNGTTWARISKGWVSMDYLK